MFFLLCFFNPFSFGKVVFPCGINFAMYHEKVVIDEFNKFNPRKFCNP
jgi:hypothetical protein